MQTFATSATADSWADGDEVTIEVFKDATAWWVGTGTWDATNEYLLLTSEEDSAGTLTNGDAVSVTAVPTQHSFLVVSRGAEFNEVAGTTYALSLADHGTVIRCTSADAVTVTATDTLPVGFHVLIVQEGAGAVSVTPGGTDTLNGATDAVGVTKQFGAGYLFQAAEGQWVVIV
jgi:hypothetical protein